MKLDSRTILQGIDRRTALILTAASGIFSCVLICGLLINGLLYRPMEQFDETGFLTMKEELKQNPGDNALRQIIRDEDFRLREGYFLSREKLKVGGWLLFGGLFIFVLSLRRLATVTERIPNPIEPLPQDNMPLIRKRTLFSMLTIPVPVVIIVLIGIALFEAAKNELEVQAVTQASAGDGAMVPREVPESEKWPGLRGHSGRGITEAMRLPVTWDVESGENILWKIPLPMTGNSSPVIWGDRLFLTGADMNARKVFCFNRLDGKLEWTCILRTQASLGEELADLEDTGLSAPTPVTDGKYVIAFYGSNELAAVDFNGGQVWSRWFGNPVSIYGVATSPCYHNGKVFLQLDQGEGEDNLSVLYAINPENGETLWKTPRDVPASWSSPIVIDTGTREELLTAATPWAISYDPETGKELWRADVLSGDVAPMPAWGNGIAFTVTEYSKLSAIRTGGSGDVTETHVEWTFDRDLPDVASPVTDGVHLLVPTGYGTTNCLDVKTGKIIWTEEFDSGFWSSPVLVGETVYMTDMEGITFVFKLSDSYKLLGKGSVNEEVFTTPAFAGSMIYIRGKKQLYCIGEKQ